MSLLYIPQPPHKTPLRRDWLPLLIILVVAAALRMGAPGITEFKRDEANLSRRALDLAHGRDLPLLGLSSSVNIPNPPISVYLMSLPFLVSDSPLVATLFVGLLNVTAVGLTWWLTRRYYGSSAAAAAGLLYAVSPWAVIYSRKIWAQDLLPPFIVGTVILALLGYGERKRWAIWATWPLLAITIQIHYAAMVMLPLVLLIAVYGLRPAEYRQSVRDHLLSWALAALVVLPAVIGAAREGWLDPGRLREAMESNPAQPHVISRTALDFAWFTVAGTNIHSLTGPEQFRHFLSQVPDVGGLLKLIPVGAVVSAAALLWHSLRTRQWTSSSALILVAWLLLPVIVFTYSWTEVVPHYMIPLMPAAYSLCGIGLATLAAALPPRRRLAVQIVSGILLAVVSVTQIGLTAALLRFLDRNATPGGFGTPVHYLLDARQAVLEQQPDTVLVISEHDRLVQFEAPAVWDVLLDRLPDVRFVNGTEMAVVPAGNGLELIVGELALKTCEAVPCPSPDSQVFKRRPGEPPIIMRPFASDPWRESLTPLEPVRFANEAYLIGYMLQPTTVLLAWQLNAPGSRDVQVFIHALDAEGSRIAQADRSFWPGEYWRTGDTVYVWLNLALPPETAALYAGLYWLDSENRPHNIEVLDSTGAYRDQAATITLK